MRRQQRHRADAIDHPLDPHKASLVDAKRQQKGNQRRPPHPRKPAEHPGHEAGRDLGPAGVARGEAQRHPGQLGHPENHDRHAQDQQIGGLRQRGDQLTGQQDAQHHKADQPPEPAHHLPRRKPAVAERLGQIGHQRRQDQPGQRQFRRQERAQPRDHDHRHREPDRALDETGKQRDRDRPGQQGRRQIAEAIHGAGRRLLRHYRSCRPPRG